MFENVRYNLNSNIPNDETRIKSSDFSNRISFKANPNAVDNTPSRDIYSPQGTQIPQEMGMGEKYLKYGVPAGLALYAGNELFNKANQGQYEKSLLGRLGKLGDNIANSRAMRSDFVTRLSSHYQTLKSNMKNFVSNHETLRVMAETPTKPESSMVVGFLETQAEDDYKKGLESLKKHYLNENPKTLRAAGATEAEMSALKTKFGTGAFGRIKNEKKAVEEFLIGKLSSPDNLENIEQSFERKIQSLQAKLADPATTKEEKSAINSTIKRLKNARKNYRPRLLKHLKQKSIGISSQEIKMMGENVMSHKDRIEAALSKASKISPKVSAAYNKVKSITTPTTKLGKLLPRMAKLGMRGLTFGGGFFNCLLMLGFFMSEAVKSTIDAPKDKKVSTAVHGFFDAMSWVVAMPIALKAMHAVNGLKNLGKSKAQVETFESALKVFNKNVKAGLYADRAVYDSKLAELMTKKNAGTAVKGFKKVLSSVAKFLSVGLGQIAPYKASTSGLKGGAKISASIGNMMRKLPNFGRNFVGYPLRFGLYMFAFQPLVDKLFSGVISGVFGKAYDPEKAKEEAVKQANLERARNPLPPAGWFSEFSKELSTVSKDGLNNLDLSTLSDKNLIRQELEKRGVKIPQKSDNKTNNNNTNEPNSVNGVSFTTKTDDPLYMPPTQNQNGNNSANGVNVVNNNQTKDPNKSEYDTIPLTYEPTISNGIPFGDPEGEQNRQRLAETIKKGDAIIKDLDAFNKKK